VLNDGSGDDNGNGNGNGGFRLSAPEPDPSKKPTIHWENLGSMRLWFGSIFFGFFLAFVMSLIGVEGGTLTNIIFFFGFAISMLGGLSGKRYWCPYCRSRVKPGATVCRQCGRDFEL